MGGSSPKTMTQTNTVKLSPQQQQVFDMALPKIQGYASSTPSLYPGSSVVGFNPLEQQAQGAALDAAGGPISGLSTAAAGAQGQLLDPNFMLNPNQYVNAAADATTSRVTQNLLERVLPNIRSGAIATGGAYSGGSTREGLATGKAIGDTNDALSRSIAEMYLSNYQQGLGHMGAALNRNQDVMTQQLFPSQIMSGVGGADRGMAQRELDDQIQKFYAGQNIDLSQAQNIMSLLQAMPGGSGVSTVSGVAPSSNPLMQILGAVGAGVGMGVGGPMGSAVGSSIGSGAGSALGGGK